METSIKKKVILCDLDGVLVNLLDSWLSIYKEMGGESIFPEDIKTWSFEGHIKNMPLFNSCLASALESAVPKIGAKAFSKLYNNPAYDVYVVTYASPHAQGLAYDTKLKWLKAYFPDFNQDNVIFTKHKHLVQGDILIEDSLENITAWLNKNPKSLAYCICAPYNYILKPYDKMIYSDDVASVVWHMETSIDF